MNKGMSEDEAEHEYFWMSNPMANASEPMTRWRD